MDQDIEIDCLLHTLHTIANQVSEGRKSLYEHNECFSTVAFDRVIQGIKDPCVSYELLKLIINNCRFFKEVQRTAFLELLYGLMISSNTTEIPDGMEEIIKENSSNTIIVSIKKWYRIQ